MTYVLAAVLVVAFAAGWAATPLVRRWAARRAFVDGPDADHPKAVPLGGGLAVGLAVLGTLSLGVGGAHLARHVAWFPLVGESVRPHLAGVAAETPRFFLLVATSLGVLLLGLVDDRRPLGPGVKLAVPLIAGTLFAVGVEPLGLFLHFEGVWADVLRVLATAVWLTLAAHLFNLMDHADGVCAGIAAIVAAAFLFVAWAEHQWFIAALLAALTGACLGFLPHNLPPATVFLGDAGSLFVGFFLGAACTLFTFYEPAKAPLHAYFIPAAVLAVPALDAGLVLARRRARGAPLFVADRTHLAHRLGAMGLAPTKALAVVYGLATVSAMGAVLLPRVDLAGALLVLVQIAIIFGILVLLERKGAA